MVAMLASDDGRYVNGQVIQVDGGILSHFSHVADMQETFWAEVAELAPRQNDNGAFSTEKWRSFPAPPAAWVWRRPSFWWPAARKSS